MEKKRERTEETAQVLRALNCIENSPFPSVWVSKHEYHYYSARLRTDTVHRSLKSAAKYCFWPRSLHISCKQYSRAAFIQAL